MIGFIKWVIREYNAYKISETLKPSTEETEKAFMSNYVRCLELGFTQERLIALMNLVYTKRSG